MNIWNWFTTVTRQFESIQKYKIPISFVQFLCLIRTSKLKPNKPYIGKNFPI